MDKITQEVMNSLIQRIDQLEARISKLEGTTQNTRKNTARGPGQATEGQLKYIKGLEKDIGINDAIKSIGEDYSMLSKQEAGDYIEKLIEEQKKRKLGKNTYDAVLMDPKVIEDSRKLSLSENIDSKSLTKEEIEEVGEENLL